MIASDRGQQPADSGGPTGSRGVRVLRPIRSGPVPPLADAFSARAETTAGLGAALVAGAVVALVPVRVAGPPPAGLAGVVRQDPARGVRRRVTVAQPRGGAAGVGRGHQPGVGAVGICGGGRQHAGSQSGG